MSLFTILGLIFLAFLAWAFAVAVRRDRRRAEVSDEGRRIQDATVRDARNAGNDMRARRRLSRGGVGDLGRSRRDRH